ncbi:MAG: penicillin acylase family protein [Natrialbaceae archaeon]|nr:penicillin acylase family protein [Natrialbaceae archaeon]
MNVEIPRRGVIALTLAVSVGALASSETARDLLDAFAPLSGRTWGRAGATLPDTISSPYGAATLHRDEEGIPQIEAEDPAAAYYAVGYVQAFDRLFGMDLQRRIMRGTLSEVVGERSGVVEDDIFYAKMDFAEAASAAKRRNEGTEVEPIARAYVEGVNDAIENEPLPIEFGVLDFEPAEWTLEDSMLVALNISWFLNGNFDGFSDNSDVQEALGSAVYNELHPEPFSHDYPIIREGMDAGGVAWSEDSPFDPSSETDDSSGLSTELASYLKRFEPPESFGSNSWVVSASIPRVAVRSSPTTRTSC